MTPTMLRRPRWGARLGTGSKCALTGAPGFAPSSSRSVTARLRSASDPAGRCPTATCACTRDIARPGSKRSGWSSAPPPPSPQAPSASEASSSAATPARRPAGALRRLLALAFEAGLDGDWRDRGLFMAAGTIPDHVRLGDALLHRLRLDLAPGKLGLGEGVPAGQVERLQGSFERRPPVLLGAEHRPDHLKLLIAEPDDPHVAS